jgi:hypothetical protein
VSYTAWSARLDAAKVVDPVVRTEGTTKLELERLIIPR